jgi:hypothetical protein
VRFSPSGGAGRRVIADHPTIANVSGTAVRDRDPPIGDFFQKTKAI